MNKSVRLSRVRDGLVAGRGVLFLGPDFAHRVDELDVDQLLESFRDQLPDASGWENLSRQDRFTLCGQSMGTDAFARLACDRFPSVEALTGVVSPFHRQLLATPFPIIVDTCLHDLAEATLHQIGARVRALSEDQDLVLRPDALPGERTLVKLRGHLWFNDVSVTVDQVRQRPLKHPALFAFLRNAAVSGPVFFYGFAPNSPIVSWIRDILSPMSGAAVMAARIDNALWRQYWTGHGFEVISAGATVALEERITRLLVDLEPGGDSEAVEPIIAEATRVVSGHLGRMDSLQWANESPKALEALDADGVLGVMDSINILSNLVTRGMPIPPRPAALAAEVCQRAGDLPTARRAVSMAVFAMADQEGHDSVACGAIGRTLIRMGDADRARPFLQDALENRDPADTTSLADDLAWLSKSVLDRIDRLRARKRRRAVTELIGVFLKEQAERLSLAALDPGEDVDLRWSVYYINLRLGRVMVLASEMAQSSGEVYAAQAVNLLERAIELAPYKPDAYKILRPLLTDRRYAVADPKRWMEIVGAAPAQVQRKLGKR